MISGAPTSTASSSPARPVLLSANPDQPCLALYLALQSSHLDTRRSRGHRREQLFQERGLPPATRAGDGVPFASPNAPSAFRSSRYGGSGAAPPSPQPYTGLPDLTYPCRVVRFSSPRAAASACVVTTVNISTVLAGQRLGIKKVDDGIWIVSFMSYDLGFIDLRQKSLQPSDNPLGPRMSPKS